MLLIFVLQNVH